MATVLMMITMLIDKGTGKKDAENEGKCEEKNLKEKNREERRKLRKLEHVYDEKRQDGM